MRRRILWLVLGMLIVPATAIHAQPFVTTRRVRLRARPSFDAPVIRILDEGEQVTLLAETGSDDFFHVRTGPSEEGWVHGKYLTPPAATEYGAADFLEARSAQYPACGGQHHFRWAAKVDLAQSALAPAAVTIPEARQWAPLDLHPGDLASWCAPRRQRELKAFSVTGWVRRVMKQEADGDWHVELTATAQSAVTSCMVVEIPDPSYDPGFQAARDRLDALLAHSTIDASGDVSPAVRIGVAGAAFFDGWHSTPTGAQGHGRCNASLGALWEIHPVFAVRPP